MSDKLAAARALLAGVVMGVDDQGIPFGDYLLLEELGRGGFGIVYRARHRESGELVALKRMRGGEHATAEERERFLRGPRIARELDRVLDEHPPASGAPRANVVRTREIGEHEGCPFFTMDLVEGRNLDTTLNEGQPSQRETAAWLRSIAEALARAHDAGVVHRDLKPANVLIDRQGMAHLVDFGSAKRFGPSSAEPSESRAIVGLYMAPEQALGEIGGQASDIYALGVILYELLTGSVPYESLCFADWVSELTGAEPVPAPGSIAPGVHPHLELICQKCLRKDRRERYQSADDLAEDLALVLEGQKPRHARHKWWAARLLGWGRRHPALSLALVGVALVLVVAASSLRVLSLSDKDAEDRQLTQNASLASIHAGMMLAQFREFADRVERGSKDPTVIATVERGLVEPDARDLQPFSRGFRDFFVLTRKGVLLAQWPASAGRILGLDYSWRSYFKGAAALATQQLHHELGGSYLGRAYRSEGSSQQRFAFAAPVFGDGGWVGCAVGSFGTAKVLGQLRAQDPAHDGSIVAIVGPRDNDRAQEDEPLPTGLFYAVHPKLEEGDEVGLGSLGRDVLRPDLQEMAAPGQQFELRWAEPQLVRSYDDPLLDSQGPMLAAFAPVGKTGYLVIVETPRERALSGNRWLRGVLEVGSGASLATVVGLLLFALGAPARRRRRLDARPRRSARAIP